MTELVYRTKMRKLSNSAHSDLAQTIFDTLHASVILRVAMPKTLPMLSNAVQNQRSYMYKKADTAQTKVLTNLLANQNKLWTALYSVAKVSLTTPLSNDMRAGAKQVTSLVSQYLDHRSSMTQAELIMAMQQATAALDTEDMRNALISIKQLDLAETLISQQQRLSQIHLARQTAIVEVGHSKAPLMREGTDTALNYVAADLFMLTLSDDESVAKEASRMIEEINVLVSSYSIRRVRRPRTKKTQ